MSIYEKGIKYNTVSGGEKSMHPGKTCMVVLAVVLHGQQPVLSLVKR
jgi:hypothetical protein